MAACGLQRHRTQGEAGRQYAERQDPMSALVQILGASANGIGSRRPHDLSERQEQEDGAGRVPADYGA